MLTHYADADAALGTAVLIDDTAREVDCFSGGVFLSWWWCCCCIAFMIARSVHNLIDFGPGDWRIPPVLYLSPASPSSFQRPRSTSFDI